MVTDVSRLKGTFDAAILLTCVVVGIQLIRFHSAAASAAESRTKLRVTANEPAPALSIGAVIKLDGVDWSKHPRQAVLLFWSSCHACESQVPFYRQLSRQLNGAHAVGFLGIGIEPLPTASEWLKKSDIRPERVIRVDKPSAIGLLITPTLLIVDSTGLVTDLWAGVMDAQTQGTFLERLSPKSAATVPITNVPDTPEIRSGQLAEVSGNPLMLDTRRRTDVTAPSQGALNIPADELWLRAPFELPQSRPIIIDCRNQQLVGCRTSAWTLTRMGISDIRILRSE